MSTDQESNLVAGSWSGALSPPAKLPSHADVVIIGGGIVGVSTAWFLARQGIDVVVCEKGYIAGEQSGRNWGWVRQQGRDLRELPMMIESLRIYRGLEEEIGEDIGFEQGGCLFSANKPSDLDGFQDWIRQAEEFDLDTRIVDDKELRKLVPGATPHWHGAMFTASDGRAEPHKTTPAIARAAERAGARILPFCAVRGVESAAAKVSAVVTEYGKIKTSTVLCAAGAWTSTFCRSMDIVLPQLQVRGTVARTSAAEKVLDGNLFDSRLGIRRRDDGGYTIAHGAILDHGITPSTFRFAFKFLPALKKEFKVLRLRFGKDFFEALGTPTHWALDEESPFERARVLNPPPNQKVLKSIRQNLGQVFPQLANTQIVESWAGMVETSPDVVPIIDEVGSAKGFYVATGFSGHGFGIGPGAGKAITAMLTGGDSDIDLSAFRLQRFFDGSPIRPMSAL